MDGSRTIKEKKSLKYVTKLFSTAHGQKRFLEGLENKFMNSDKLLIFHQSAEKGSSNLVSKKKMDYFCW